MKKIYFLLIACFCLFAFGKLEASSLGVQESTSIAKQHGKGNILMLHEQYRSNIFSGFQILIEKQDEKIQAYRIGGKIFDKNHSLFIKKTDPLEKRIIQNWKKTDEGIYTQTVLQEDTFELIDGVYTPRQSVIVHTYYRLTYNHDTTPPVCQDTILSRDADGGNTFLRGENPWMSQIVYGYFVCSDPESSCMCAGDECEDVPYQKTQAQAIEHAEAFQTKIQNTVNLSQTCHSDEEHTIFYDMESPDMHILLDGVKQENLPREYVINKGILYDGENISDTRFYNIEKVFSFKARSDMPLSFQIYDPSTGKANRGVSGIKSYEFIFSEFHDGMWKKIDQKNKNFEPYNPDADKSTSHEVAIDVSDMHTFLNSVRVEGKYQVYIYFEDYAGNRSRVVVHYDVIPGDISPAQSTITSDTKNAKYANAKDTYTYTLTLRDAFGNRIPDAFIDNISHECGSTTGCMSLFTDMRNLSGESTLEIFNKDSKSNNLGEVSFSLRASSPGSFTESFKIVYYAWDDNGELEGNKKDARLYGASNTFLRPIVGVFEVLLDGVWQSAQIPLDTQASYRVRTIEQIPMRNNSIISGLTATDISPRHPDANFSLSGSLRIEDDGYYFQGSFTGSFDENTQHLAVLDIANTSGVSPIEVSTIVDEKEVFYYLSPDSKIHTKFSLGGEVKNQKAVRIIGTQQAVGTLGANQDRENTSQISPTQLRQEMRKRINDILRSMQHNTQAQGVKYIDASQLLNPNYSISGDPDFETLIVKNGNIVIENDFNLSKKPIGLISYFDTGYQLQDGYEKLGNIYIEDTVGEIHAFMYADGALVSTKSETPIPGDILTRNSLLSKQLYIRGSIFSRNTLGGSTQRDNHYLLPGDMQTDDKALAVQYDFHMLRRGRDDCTEINPGICRFSEFLIIEYDDRIISTPPKVFR